MGLKSFCAIFFSALLLAACTTAAPPTAAPTNTPGQAGATPTATAEAPSPTNTPSAAEVDRPQGGTLVHLYRDPPTLDPHLTTDNVSAGLVNEIFGGLMTINLDLEVVPDLAESIEVSPDGTVYTFRLRQDARFHDGKPVTAHDVEWSLERAADPATQSPVGQDFLSDIVGAREKFQGTADSISGLRVLDDHTIEITIDAPKTYFPAKLTHPATFVLDQENVEGTGDQWMRQPNGTGPFRLVQYDVGETLRLARNEHYHLGPPHLDEVHLILSGGTAMLMYENNEIHLTTVGLADLDRVLDPQSPLNAQLHTAPASFSTQYIGMNVNQPPLDDPKVRQALNLAVNKESINAQVLSGLLSPANGILPPGFPGYNPDLESYDYDPELARQLLQESSYGDRLNNLPRITVNITGGFGANVPLDLEVILQSWEAELGIRVDIQQTEWATFLQDLHARRYQMYSVGWSADYPDPENFLDVLFHSESDNNQTGYSNPEVDALLEEARVEQDQERRFELYHQVEQMIMNDAPWIPLWNSSETYVLVKPEVRDYHLTPMTIPVYRYVYFEQD